MDRLESTLSAPVAGRSPSSPAEDLHRQLAECVDRARTFDLRKFETGDATLALGVAVPQMRSLVKDAIRLLGQVLDQYDKTAETGELELDFESDETGDFFSAVDDLMDSDDSAQRLADLAFMANMELNGRIEALARLDESVSHWEVVAICSSSQRRVLKAIAAVDRALREKEALDVGLDEGFVTELTLALEIRRVYASFRKAITNGPEPTRETVHRRIRLGGVQIAMLLGREVYGQLRIMDRIEIRKLQARILQWLRDPEPEARDGLRIWQDLNAFASLLAQVNRRSLLRDHDLARLLELHRQLQEPAALTAPSSWPIWMESLRVLWGRDDELDHLIDRSNVHDLNRWKQVVLRLVESLQGESAVPAPVSKDISDVILEIDRRRKTLPPGQLVPPEPKP